MAVYTVWQYMQYGSICSTAVYAVRQYIQYGSIYSTAVYTVRLCSSFIQRLIGLTLIYLLSTRDSFKVVSLVTTQGHVTYCRIGFDSDTNVSVLMKMS